MAYEIVFPSSVYSPPTDSDQVSYVRFTPTLQSVQSDFRLRNAQYVCHISLYGSSISSTLDVLESALDGASDFQLYTPCTCLTKCSKFDENSNISSQDLGEAMLGFATPRDIASLISIQVSCPAMLVKLGFSPDICSL
jgi:hypothetical protein